LEELTRGLLESHIQDIIDQADNDVENQFIIPEEEIQNLFDEIDQAENDLDEAVVEFFEDQTEIEGSVLPEDTESNGLLKFFIAKALIEGVARIHSASVARQILDSDRNEVRDSAIARSLDLITAAAESESSSSFALKHQALAIESGFEYYIYNTSEDDVVRESHNGRNQMAFRYGSERTVDDVKAVICQVSDENVHSVESGSFLANHFRKRNLLKSLFKLQRMVPPSLMLLELSTNGTATITLSFQKKLMLILKTMKPRLFLTSLLGAVGE